MPELHCETITFPSSDGRHTSSAVLYTMPGKPVRAVLQLSHGMCEYVRRYAPMAEFYADHGIALRAMTIWATAIPPRQVSMAITVSRTAACIR